MEANVTLILLLVTYNHEVYNFSNICSTTANQLDHARNMMHLILA